MHSQEAVEIFTCVLGVVNYCVPNQWDVFSKWNAINLKGICIINLWLED